MVTGDLTNMTMGYVYDATSKLLTTLNLTNADGNNAVYNYTYDTYKRPSSIIETGAYAKFTKWFTYDAFGRFATEESEARLLANNKFSKRKVQYAYQNGGRRVSRILPPMKAFLTLPNSMPVGKPPSSLGEVALTR
ncbi:MAG: hypothetical protein HC794_01620 [Nitrospiraceae bacterium]|nr:hypothetical protein [Nitrospiraceae bacterium]